MTTHALVHDQLTGRWLRFRHPSHILTSHRLADVGPLLREIDTMVQTHSRFAVGFVSYEAAPAFDPALRVRPDGDFPLIWFALFDQSTPVPAPTWPERSVGLSWRPSITRGDYDGAIRRIRRHIARGDCYQTNFSFRLRSLSHESPMTLFRALHAAQPTPYAAFIENPELAVCSVSPELFFSLDGRRLVCKPMKGTAPRGLTFEDDRRQAERLCASDKEQAENLMIVDMTRNDLGRIASVGSVRVPALFSVEKYPTVWQMTSTVTGTVSSGLADIFQALFPAASVTGAPKPRVTRIISELESSPRRLYTGAIGFWGPGRRAQFNVGIRTLCADKRSGRCEYGIGSGVVWQSRARSEFDECRTKAKILFTPSPTFDVLETLLWTPSDGFFLLERHVERMKRSAAYFDFVFDEREIRRRLRTAAEKFSKRPMKVRVLLGRSGRLTMESRPQTPTSSVEPIRIRLAARPIERNDRFLYHKTTQRDVYRRALTSSPGAADVLLWNDDGELTESCFANLAIERRGRLFTPPVRCGLLAGTYRAQLLADDVLRERILRKADLKAADRIFLFNSVRRMMEVRVY